MVINEENFRVIDSHPNSIVEIRNKFGEEVKDLSKYNIPSDPHYRTVRPDEKEELLDGTDQTRYRSGVGMFLYMVKLSRPDLTNAVRELSKVDDGATLGQYS